ncbi:MAG TPA: CHRD domain-containing protein [Prolixibacteraceae bacterium]|nr:CHRD domain-containing protein [Prolixibacteraceae bacterium]
MKTIINFIPVDGRSVLITVFVFLFGFSACNKNDQTVTDMTVKYSGSFVKSGDAVVTSATGNATASFNTNTMVLTYSFNWSGLSSNAAAMHFHDAGPVIIPITGFTQTTSGTFSGTATLTADQATDLAAGKIYIQIHSVNIPGGEIKATLAKVNSTSTSGGGGGYGY